MPSNNQKLKKDFDNLWNQKLENSKYNLEESILDTYSARQCKIGDTLIFYSITKQKPKLVFGETIKTEPIITKEKIIGKVVKKPTYKDEYFKMRPGAGFLVLQEENGDIFSASIKNVFAKVK